MTDDAQPTPDELDQGLAFAYGQESQVDGTHSVLGRIGEITGSKPQVLLRDESNGDTPMLKPLASGDRVEAGKYVVQGELGRGGVGTVHRGHDQDLGRDVAMKFLHEKYKNHPDILHRFVEEAQIGGQLQHPGIVPVYDLGLVDGKPFFAMKLVKGQTLARKLADCEASSSERRTFLAIFEDVCQTLAYAHARGVVHRDLKPANIMIGSFGEVQVVDWGMGKVLATGGVADERLAAERRAEVSVIETVRSDGHGSQSMVGSVMGTPAYMPPEQARGDVEHMDERSDVFALGAILCEILTGAPPYTGTLEEQLSMAAMAELEDARARLAACAAEPEMVELALRCLMPAPAARPRSAEVVAKAVHDHLAAVESRVHAARVEAAEAQVRATELKQKQRLGLSLLVVIAVGLAASLWFWKDADRQRGYAEQGARDARAAQGLEQTARELADANAAEARANLANFNRLSQVVRLESAKAREVELNPAWPSRSAAMQAWLDHDAKELVGALPELRTTLAELERKALPETHEEQAAAVNTEVPTRTKWRFEADLDSFLHATLRRLVVDIEAFEQKEVAAVRDRLAWSQRVGELTITRYRELWDEARLAILAADGETASHLYADTRFELMPQMGLIPIGMNPVTGLWEFYHLRSAWDGTSDPGEIELPRHGEDGTIAITGDSGVVFVLVPGGTFTMGSQKEDPAGQNFDEQAKPMETPHQVTLSPFLLARHELTQGQWARLWIGDETLRRPSEYGLGYTCRGTAAVTDAHPVEQVDWETCDAFLARHRLVMPTEAQWEYACRGTTTTPFWCDFDELKDFENLADATPKPADFPWISESWTDGYVVHAPVGTFSANRFGLHDVHGNVVEWCRDLYGDYGSARQGDGLSERPSSTYRVMRGGSFNNLSLFSRSANRMQFPSALPIGFVGLRPARELQLRE